VTTKRIGKSILEKTLTRWPVFVDHFKFLDFPDYQVRELPAFFVKVSVATALLFILLFAYPLLAVFVYVRCKHSQKKYSGEHTDITSQNMRVWLRRCQEKWGRRHG
ncbi:hypothetical protein R9R02_02950, partial [Escherichia coli]